MQAETDPRGDHTPTPDPSLGRWARAPAWHAMERRVGRHSVEAVPLFYERHSQRSQRPIAVPRRRRERPIDTVPRRLLTRAEAAASLGMSVAHFERYVQPFVKVVPCGQLLLVEPVSLDRWVEDNARLASAVA